MHVHKLTITIPRSRHIEIDLPTDLPEGEVIVLFRDGSSARPHAGSREAILAEEPITDAWRAANPDKLRTADEIDAQLDEERESWGDDG